MKKLLLVLTLCVLTLGLAGGALAQDSAPEPPFMEMLRAVPRDVPGGMNLISYADAKALVESRPGTFWPQDLAELWAAEESKDPRFDVTQAALSGLRVGMTHLAEVALLPGMREAVGFDFFTVIRTLEFGQIPAEGDVLQGDFDEAAIGAALVGRGFTQRSFVTGGAFWCGPDGCLDGLRVNLTDRNPADPFGGMLGRKQPLVFIEPDTLLSSAWANVIQAMLASLRSSENSILGLPEYQAAAEAITARGTLLQAVLIPPGLIDGAPAQKGIARVPRYALAVFAHVRDTEDILTLVGLVYPNEQLAAQARDMLLPAFNASQSLRAGRPFSEIIAERDGAIAQGQTFLSPSNDYAVALLEIRSPVESPEPDANFEPAVVRPSGLIFAWLTYSLGNMDIPWLVPNEP